MDFQAVVLAGGKGSRMSDLTAKLPKAMLPVGPRPMVWYALHLLQLNGFKEAIIVIPASCRAEIMGLLQSYTDLKLKLSEEVVQNTEELTDVGTADVLRDIIKTRKIKDKDLLVISGDLITEASLDPLLTLHYQRNSALTVLFAPINPGLLASQAPGPKMKRKVEKDLVGLECETKRLMFMSSEADFEESLKLKRRVIKCCPRFRVHSNLQDAHVYIISKSTFDIWVPDREINSIKGDLIPFLCRKQFSNPKPQAESDLNANEMSFWNCEAGKMKTDYSCHAHVETEKFCIRANSLSTFMYVNRQMPNLWGKLTAGAETVESFIYPATEVGEKSTIGTDCFVWKNVSVGKQSVVRGCVIGPDCKIGHNVKLTSCVVMDKAVIGDDCVLQGSIVRREATLLNDCKLTNSVVAVDQLAASTKSSSEIITNEDRFIEIA